MASDISSIVAQASSTYNVPASVIYSVIQQESGGNPNAVSPKGAMGLMQLMPSTAASLGVTDPFDPEQNIMAGTSYLASLINQYNGDIASALAAYNWGPGNVNNSNGNWPSSVVSYVSNVLQNAGIGVSSQGVSVGDTQISWWLVALVAALAFWL
jgi:soluble lytic murein transglycosylase-like protein